MRYVISALAVGMILAAALRDDVSRAMLAFWQGEPVGLTVSVPFKRFEFTFGNSAKNLSWSGSHSGKLYRVSSRQLTLLNTEIQKIYEQIAVMLGDAPLKKVFVNVRLVDSDAELNDYARSVGSNMGGSSGVYIHARNEAVVVRKPKPKETLDVIHHESVHIILAGLVGKVPKWLNEGLAEYLEPIEIQGQAIQIDFREEWQKQLERGSRKYDVGELFSLNRNSWGFGNHAYHYAQACNLVHGTA